VIRFLTAGESHGSGLTAIIEGLPANVPVDIDLVNHELWRRQQGYGRGGRMKIESDKVEIVSGLRFGKTLGSPLGFILRNNDWKNWQDEMAVYGGSGKEKISRPRPGHADYSGKLKYDFDDIRNVLERSSARETAMRVAVGGVVRQFLSYFNIRIFSHVLQIGPLKADSQIISGLINDDDINERADKSPVRCLDEISSEKMVDFIRDVKRQGDTAGGIIQVIIRNVPPGLGSHTHWDKKLDALLAASLMSIQAVKGIEVGPGFQAADRKGSEFHDELFYSEDKYYRKTNRAGGVEGGMSNGEDIVLQIMMKPIPTLMKPLHSVDMQTKKTFLAHRERSDVTAVPACSVIAEAVVAPVLANVFIEKFGADTLPDIEKSFNQYKNRIEK